MDRQFGRPLDYHVKSDREKRNDMVMAREALQRRYDVEKQVYEEKMRQKEQKKRLEKLARYKGIGELGNKLGDTPMSEKKKTQEMKKVRNVQQKVLSTTLKENQELFEKKLADVRLKEQTNRLEKLDRYERIDQLGNRLGDMPMSEKNKPQEMKDVKNMQQKILNETSKENEELFENRLAKIHLREENERLGNLACSTNFVGLGQSLSETLLTDDNKIHEMRKTRNMKQEMSSEATLMEYKLVGNNERPEYDDGNGKQLGGRKNVQIGKGYHPLLDRLTYNS